MTHSAVLNSVLASLLLVLLVGCGHSTASKEVVRQSEVPRELTSISGGGHFPDEAEAFTPLVQRHDEESATHFAEVQQWPVQNPLDAWLSYGVSRYGLGLLQAARAYWFAHGGQYPAAIADLEPYSFLWHPGQPDFRGLPARLVSWGELAGMGEVPFEDAIAEGAAFAVRFNGEHLDFLLPVMETDTTLRWEPWEERPIDCTFAPDEMRHPDLYQRPKLPVDAAFFEQTQGRPLSEIRPIRVWADLNSRALIMGQPDDVRYAAAFDALKTLVIDAVSGIHSFPQSLDELERAAHLRLHNLDPAPAGEADLRLFWDGIQAYLIEVTYPSGLTCSTVIYFRELVDWTAEHFAAPRYAYDQFVGREWQPLGAWNLAPVPSLPS